MKKNIKYILLATCLLTKVDAAFQEAVSISLLPADIPEARALGLAHLKQTNAWSAHERFWAAGGVIDPNTYDKQQELHAAFADTPIAFLNDLSTKLSTAITAAGATPSPETVEGLVRQSQQILLTVAGGTPGADGPVRLNPANAADWEVIRKAIFLALSMTSDPEKGGRSFLSTLYDCGVFYPKKTDPQDARTYFWKIEALAKSFSSLWQGLQAGELDEALTTRLQRVLNKSDPVDYLSCPAHSPWSRGSTYPFLRAAYEQAKAMISVGSARAELIAAQALHPRLNFQQAFITLYPDLTAYTEYHVPNERAEMLMGAVRPVIAPIAFTPVRVCLNYTAGKWSLKGKNETSEHIIWSQGASASEEFIGSLEDDRGTHLFNFRVDGAVATIKAISTGYVINSVGVGATVVVANGEELGFVETSAYPTTTDNDTDKSNPALYIDTDYYLGMKGVLVSRRDSTWVRSKQVNLRNAQGYETKTNVNGNSYKFFSQRGHGIFAYKDVVLESNDTHLSFSEVIAGQWVALMCSSSSDPSLLATHGAVVSAGDTLYINMGSWHAETEDTCAGISDTENPVFSPGSLITKMKNQVFNSNQALIQHSRMLSCYTHQLYASSASERDKFTTGADVYGYFGAYIESKLRFFLPPQAQAPAKMPWRELDKKTF